MPTFTIEHLPEGVYERLKQSAEEHDRTIAGEAVVCLEHALGISRNPEVILARVRRLRERLDVPPLTNEFLRQAKEDGRP